MPLRMLVLLLAVPFFYLAACADTTSNADATSSGETPAALAAGADTVRDERGPASLGGRFGTVGTAAGDHLFEPTQCVMDEGEAEISGPGTGPDGTPVYVHITSGSAGSGSLRIDVGIDRPFASSDDILNIHELTYSISERVLTGGGVLTDSQSFVPIGQATVEVSCR